MIVLAGGQAPNGLQLRIDDSCTGARRVSGLELFHWVNPNTDKRMFVVFPRPAKSSIWGFDCMLF